MNLVLGLRECQRPLMHDQAGERLAEDPQYYRLSCEATDQILETEGGVGGELGVAAHDEQRAIVVDHRRRRDRRRGLYGVWFDANLGVRARRGAG